MLGLYSSYALFRLAGALLFLGEFVSLARLEHRTKVLWLYVRRQVTTLSQNEPTVIANLIDQALDICLHVCWRANGQKRC